MKVFKRVLALMVTAMMLMAMTAPAMATSTPGTITINNAVVGQRYEAYKMFDLSYDDHGNTDPTDDGYSYYIDPTSPWYPFLTSDIYTGKNYIDVTEVADTYIVTWKAADDAETVAAFAAAAEAYIGAAGSITAVASEAATSETVTLATPDLGYYLVTSTVGFLVQLTTATPSVTLDAKNDAPTIEKYVQEDDGGTWVEVNHSAAGMTLNFRIIIHATNGAQNYVLHDTLDAAHMTLNDGSIKVYRNTHTLTPSTDYTVNTEPDGDHCTFEITFAENLLKDLTDTDDLIVEYTAQFADNVTAANYADITNTSHTNSAELTYGENNTTVKAETETSSFGIEITKYTKSLDHRLAGAVFELYRDESCTDQAHAHKLVTTVDGVDVYAICNNPAHYTVVGDGTAITQITTPEGSGTFIVYGVDMQKYWLKEVQAPAGYNPLNAPVLIDINLNNVTSARIYDTNIENNTGSILPSTGGIGTTIFYTVGGLLVVGAVVLLITKKRMSAEK